jgi:hypothetical protein
MTQMRSLAWKKPRRSATLTGHGILIMALMISFPVIGLDQFLRTTPAKFSEQPVIQVQHWLSDSLMALPLFAVGIWGGDLIARRAGIGTRHPVKRALLISLLTALAMSLAWFQVDRTTNPVTAQPLIFPHAQDSGDVYWVVPGVIVALLLVYGIIRGRRAAAASSPRPVLAERSARGGNALHRRGSPGRAAVPGLGRTTAWPAPAWRHRAVLDRHGGARPAARAGGHDLRLRLVRQHTGSR